jgi:hypothetical protein
MAITLPPIFFFLTINFIECMFGLLQTQTQNQAQRPRNCWELFLENADLIAVMVFLTLCIIYRKFLGQPQTPNKDYDDDDYDD